ncbi:MAG: tetratricopeptide repeat protein, partial [Cyclobacteriaceae bacterium]
ACKREPNYAPFYLARADLLRKTKHNDELGDLQRALELAPKEWRTYSALIRYYDENSNQKEALKLSAKAYKKFPSNYNLGMSHAKALLNNGEYKKCIESLKNIEVLPFEGASQGRTIYEQSHLLYAMAIIEKKKYKEAISILKEAMEWPENLGVGKPYDPDNRAEDYLLAYCYDHLSKPSQKEAHLKNTIEYTKEFFNPRNPNNLLGLLSLQESGNKQQADHLLKEIMDSDAGPVTDWVMAQYSNQSEAALDQGNKESNLRYRILNKIVALAN